MKPGPIIAMIALIFVGMWLVLQPQLARQRAMTEGAMNYEMRIGPREVVVEQRPVQTGKFEYRFLEWPEQGESWIDQSTFAITIDAEARRWAARPRWELAILGFFNISSWNNLVWILLGLAGQGCFFGRMFIQWIVSEKERKSVVPELFWWFSFFGGAILFTYFVWRVDIVGVLGQSTGVVIYARNLRLIHKQKRRLARDGQDLPEQGSPQEPQQGD